MRDQSLIPCRSIFASGLEHREQPYGGGFFLTVTCVSDLTPARWAFCAFLVAGKQSVCVAQRDSTVVTGMHIDVKQRFYQNSTRVNSHYLHSTFYTAYACRDMILSIGNQNV